MVTTGDAYHELIQDLLITYSQIPHLQETLHDETIFDRAAGRYMLVTVGWQGRKRVNTIVLHLDVVDGQVIIQCNNTDQDIVQELIAAGIAADAIVHPQLAASAEKEAALPALYSNQLENPSFRSSWKGPPLLLLSGD